MITREVIAGRIRADMEEEQIFLSLLGMLVFPILIEPVLGHKLDKTFAEKRIDHIQKLFFEGARPQDKPRGNGPRIRQL